MPFDPTRAIAGIERFWKLKAEFGDESSAYSVYLDDMVSDRYALVSGVQILRDELQFAGDDMASDVRACGADLTLPSVVTTVGHTNCGDRIHQGESTALYARMVASRFATMSEIGEYKLEAFSPTGGGTDDGATLAHVTVAHQMDEPLRKKVYDGNKQSFVLVAIDLMTHCGRLDPEDKDGGKIEIGRTVESRWREPRAACGAIVGTLGGFNAENGVHRRLRADLGEANYEFLSKNKIMTPDGVNVTMAVAAAIVAVQGMLNTAHALAREMDERGLGHTTASVTINRPHKLDTIVYLARATIFNGKIKWQGLGTDATKYSAHFVEKKGDPRLVLTYEGHDEAEYPIQEIDYEIKYWKQGGGAHH